MYIKEINYAVIRLLYVPENAISKKKRKGDRQIMLELLGRFGGLYWGGAIRLCAFLTIDPAVLHGFG